ncbi:MAG: Cobyrinic acid a,c-diamide synthetase, partial [uncultured Solirubrobacteraceae bacterium]
DPARRRRRHQLGSRQDQRRLRADRRPARARDARAGIQGRTGLHRSHAPCPGIGAPGSQPRRLPQRAGAHRTAHAPRQRGRRHRGHRGRDGAVRRSVGSRRARVHRARGQAAASTCPAGRRRLVDGALRGGRRAWLSLLRPGRRGRRSDLQQGRIRHPRAAPARGGRAARHPGPRGAAPRLGRRDPRAPSRARARRRARGRRPRRARRTGGGDERHGGSRRDRAPGPRRTAVDRGNVVTGGRRAADRRRPHRHRPRSGLLLPLPGEPRAPRSGRSRAPAVRPARRRGAPGRHGSARAGGRLSRGLRRRAGRQCRAPRAGRRLRRCRAAGPRRVRGTAVPVRVARWSRDVRRPARSCRDGQAPVARLPGGDGGHRHTVAGPGRARPRPRVPLLAGRAARVRSGNGVEPEHADLRALGRDGPRRCAGRLSPRPLGRPSACGPCLRAGGGDGDGCGV